MGGGDIGVSYLRGPIGVVGQRSLVECWVDDHYVGVKVIENAVEIGDAIPMYVLFPFLAWNPYGIHMDQSMDGIWKAPFHRHSI